ncbi:hypothetical protein [Oryza sativa Japonica Group]|uniref:Uncharacterized protein n=1 Tax=Oryza sativa subsp. japonica TaxID=39947 RepID=Q5JKI5_ORYSJ|nr:hypothetical protein [Oryza sativa Japonica Group]BAD88007.1 hypothetical protein [Oryza sativa Japonica Group]
MDWVKRHMGSHGGKARGEEEAPGSDGSQRRNAAGERRQAGGAGRHRKREGLKAVPSTGSDEGEAARWRPCGGGMGGTARTRPARRPAVAASRGDSLGLKGARRYEGFGMRRPMAAHGRARRRRGERPR